MIKIKSQADSAEIYIYGDIVDDATGGCIEEYRETNTNGYQWPDELRKQLDECKGKPLTIYINSDGGSVPAGVAMANMVARHDAPTTAVVDGWCCSIATQIFFAAQTRKIPENAYLMIHKPSAYVGGDANDLRNVADALDVIQQGLETTYQKAAKGATDAEEIHKLVETETWLTGKATAELFQVELLAPVEAVAKAGANKNKLRNIPESIRFAATNKPTQGGTLEKKNKIAIALAMAEGV